MTKKKSNGFMHFADSRRAFYEAEAGCSLDSRRLVERAADDWKEMTHTEQEYWKNESRRRHGGQGSSRHVSSHFTPQPHRPKQRVMSQLERELIERAKERGVDRVTARQTLTDKLLWKEKGEVATIRMQRWALLALSKDSVGAIPNEICAVVMENGEVAGEMRLIRRGFQPKPTGNAQNVRNIMWDPSVPSEVNTTALELVRFVQDTWNGLVMIPEHQMSRLGIAMHWMKQSRDVYCKRDTSTMRLDRIMCLEDVITVFRQINERSTVDIEEDEQYEQLRDLELSDTILFARATAEYFTRVMKMCTLPQHTLDSTAIIQHHNTPHFLSQHDLQPELAHLDISDGSSTIRAATQVAAQGDSCWMAAPPKCSQRELYPLALEPPRHPISGKLATNPFNKPADIQPPERDFSHVTRWLETIQLDDIEIYQEPFPGASFESAETAERYRSNPICDD